MENWQGFVAVAGVMIAGVGLLWKIIADMRKENRSAHEGINKRIDDAQKENNRRFDDARKESNRRFDDARKENNRRFDDAQKENNRRFDDARKENNRRFEESNRRFDDVQNGLRDLILYVKTDSQRPRSRNTGPGSSGSTRS